MTATQPTNDAWLSSIMDWIENPVIESGIKTLTVSTNGPKHNRCKCGRCGGTGVIDCYRTVNGGECFKCKGKGYTEK